MTSILAWHFTNGKTLRDSRLIPQDGTPLIHNGPMVLCKSGLHASRRLIDALQYARGSMIHRVRCSGDVQEEGDKLICRRRVSIWRIDADELLRSFARQCALDVAHLWDMSDVVRKFLETGDDKLRDAAWNAARRAALTAPWNAAKAAACNAARAAAWSAYCAAAETVAWDTARAAYRNAVGAACWNAGKVVSKDGRNKRLTAMVMAAHREQQG
jgi:hypothetical protein